MNKLRRPMLIILCLLLFILAACQREGETENKQENLNEIVYASTKDIRDINPHLYSGEMAAQNMVFESLVVNTADGIQPGLAESWDISADGLEYTLSTHFI